MRALIARNWFHACARRYSSTESVKQLSNTVKPKRSTVDHADVEHHTKLGEKWWDVKGEMRGLHSLNPLRIQLVRDGLANAGFKEANPVCPLEGVKILDVGCGGGILTEPLARIGANVTGVDASSQLITIAKEHATLDPGLSGRLSYIHSTVEEVAITHSETFDAVVASEILEHVSDPELFLKSCADTLKPGGSIFVTTFNKTLQSWLGGILVAEYLFKLIPLGTHDWNKFISPEETRRLLEKCKNGIHKRAESCGICNHPGVMLPGGCKTKLIHGTFYNPLKNDWFWRESTAINYAIHAIKQGESSH